VDFYCPALGLVIEATFTSVRRRRRRSRAAVLHALGLRVLRFKNDPVSADVIIKALNTTTKQP